MRLRNLSLVAVLAVLTFGGTFTCTTNSDDDDDRPRRVQTAPARAAV